jgi:hypothetical protein
MPRCAVRPRCETRLVCARGVAHLSPVSPRCAVAARSRCRDRGLTICALATRARPRCGVASDTRLRKEERVFERLFYARFCGSDGDPRHTPRGSAMATRRSRIPDPRRSFRRSRPGRRTGGPPSCSRRVVAGGEDGGSRVECMSPTVRGRQRGHSVALCEFDTLHPRASATASGNAQSAAMRRQPSACRQLWLGKRTWH